MKNTSQAKSLHTAIEIHLSPVFVYKKIKIYVLRGKSSLYSEYKIYAKLLNCTKKP